ncbi:MAG TPA: MOSC N-terminal beta barrel domain-containing protein, partial [Jiangellaceae bacterium]
MRVAGLHVYPVKSTRARDVSAAEVEPWGLAGDRRFMVVDSEGRHLTAREEPRLLSVSAVQRGASDLILHGPHADPVVVPRSQYPTTWVKIWRDDVLAVQPSAAADAWFSALLERDARLVWLSDPISRQVNPAYAEAGDTVSFADGYPLLLTATASLSQLNDWITAAALQRGDSGVAPLPMRRFRPNVVVETMEPFAEDGWQKVHIGSVPFRVAKGCDRCVLTTIDPDTLVKGLEPIRTLALHRKRDGK